MDLLVQSNHLNGIRIRLRGTFLCLTGKSSQHRKKSSVIRGLYLKSFGNRFDLVFSFRFAMFPWTTSLALFFTFRAKTCARTMSIKLKVVDIGTEKQELGNSATVIDEYGNVAIEDGNQTESAHNKLLLSIPLLPSNLGNAYVCVYYTLH